MTQEYPKALYKGGSIEATHSVIVVDEDDEALQREQGYTDFADIAQVAGTDVGKAPGDAITDKDVLLVEAAALGIKVDSRWGASRLASEIATVKAAG